MFHGFRGPAIIVNVPRRSSGSIPRDLSSQECHGFLRWLDSPRSRSFLLAFSPGRSRRNGKNRTAIAQEPRNQLLLRRYPAISFFVAWKPRPSEASRRSELSATEPGPNIDQRSDSLYDRRRWLEAFTASLHASLRSFRGQPSKRASAIRSSRKLTRQPEFSLLRTSRVFVFSSTMNDIWMSGCRFRYGWMFLDLAAR